MTTHFPPLVSVVIPFYNCPYIDQSISSVLNQTYPHIEIIVVDDGSTIHLDKLSPFHGRMRYFSKPNGGTASALNYGIQMAQGDYIVWQSSDDMMYPHKIERQLSFMREHNALICCTDFNVIDANSDVIMQNMAPKFPSARLFIEVLLTFCPINGSTIMMHRSLPPIIGRFDESLFCVQDYDYWIRVHLARIDFYYLVETLTLYRLHDGMGTVQKKELSAAEFIRVRDRYAPLLQALLNLL